MISMKLSPEKRKEMSSPRGPRYPYGLRLCLDDEQIGKLKMPADLRVGGLVHVMGVARVIEVGQDESAGNGKGMTRRMELQIEDLAIEVKSKKPAPAEHKRTMARALRALATRRKREAMD
jgi:hypothetical protein